LPPSSGELQAAAIAAKVASTKLVEERLALKREIESARAEARLAKQALRETGGENASQKLQSAGDLHQEMQESLIQRLDMLNAQREKASALKARELEETGSSIEEVRALRAEAAALRAELDIRLRDDPKTLQILRLQLRDYSISCSQLEQERSRLMRRATGAEQQLESMQDAMSDHLTRYQKEILRLKALPTPASPRSGAGSGLSLPTPSAGGLPRKLHDAVAAAGGEDTDGSAEALAPSAGGALAAPAARAPLGPLADGDDGESANVYNADPARAGPQQPAKPPGALKPLTQVPWRT
jgi:hypothetical protein